MLDPDQVDRNMPIEWFSCYAMQGMLSNPVCSAHLTMEAANTERNFGDVVAETAVDMGIALAEELQRRAAESMEAAKNAEDQD